MALTKNQYLKKTGQEVEVCFEEIENNKIVGKSCIKISYYYSKLK